MNENELAVDVLSQDLSPAGRRRLWLVGKLIEHNPVATALDIAVRLEKFITEGAQAGLALEAQTSDPALPRLGATVPQMPRGDAVREGERADGRRPLLDHATRDSFVREAATNNDNRHLARKFGLTVRQAHAIRLGLAREIARRRCEAPDAPTAAPHAAPVPDRAAELAMQEEFLRRKPPLPPTMDDVVRYLRQIGDVVVSEGENYLVNARLTLRPPELVERANKKRRERGLPPFSVPASGETPVTEEMAHPEPCVETGHHS